MSKTEELASQSERVADSRLEDDAYEWSVEADVQLRMCAAELRRLAQVERELETLKASIGEPVACIQHLKSDKGRLFFFDEVDPPPGDDSYIDDVTWTKLYAIKEVKP